MYKTVFTIDGFAEVYIGYTDGRTWNGWATPSFEVDEALALMENFNKVSECRILYSKASDTFILYEPDQEVMTEYKGYNGNTTEGIKHLYDIGSWYWIWDEVQADDYLAQEIEEILWDFDTYEYKDCYDYREDLLKEIKAQLQDLKVLKQVVMAFKMEELSREELLQKLKEALKV